MTTTTLRIPYGTTSVDLDVEQGTEVEFASPAETPANVESISESLENPCDSVDLQEFITERKKLLVAVNDHTRPTPSYEVMKHLHFKNKEVTTIIASGSHRLPNPQEIQRIVGGNAPSYDGRLILHRSDDQSSLRPFGETRRGTKLFFNQLLFEVDGIIVVGSVEPHYFAGYTGGRKFLLPGLAGLDSIVMNHSLAADESARILALDGNPVHDDFMEALQMFGRQDDIFSIQLVLNAQHQVCYASSGNIVGSFAEAVEHARQVYVPTIKEKADIVISVAKPPMDVDLYQSQKAIDNVKLSVKKDGIIILVSSCWDGIGDRGFYDLITSGKVLDRTSAHRFGFHKAVKLANLLKNNRVFAVTNLPPETVRAISLTPYREVQKAFADAAEIKGRESKVLVVLDGGVTVPLPKAA
jgi:nickel-dependent lactate racemase